MSEICTRYKLNNTEGVSFCLRSLWKYSSRYGTKVIDNWNAPERKARTTGGFNTRISLRVPNELLAEYTRLGMKLNKTARELMVQALASQFTGIAQGYENSQTRRSEKQE
jgi:hypothetical protein